MLTSEGQSTLARLTAHELAGGSLVVSDGNQDAEAPIEEIVADGPTCTVRATFGETAANFEWSVRRVLRADRKVIDAESVDLGRKAPGTVWTLKAIIDFTPAEG